MATPSDIAPQLSNPSLKAKPVVILSAGADSRTTSATPAGPHRRKDSKHKKRKVGATPKHHRKQARPSRVAVVVGEPPTAQSRVPFPQPQTYDERGPTSTEQPEKNWSWFWPESKSDRYPPKHPEHYTDFDRKYAPDRYGDEAGDNARVWKIYRDRASAYSGDLIYNWDKMLDILLLFAALFSAVATAFLVESQKSLRPDYEAYMAKQMFATVSAMQGKNVSTAPPTDPSDFKPAMSARWVNGLWFCSLGLALSVSLLATLVKQWLSEFNSGLNDPAASARHWMLRRIVYDTGLTKWRLAVIISALPVILHISLLLFFMGLVVFLWSLDRDIAKLMLAGACAMSTFYLFATFMPLWQIDCPTATPLLRVAQQALLTANEWFQRRFSKLVKRHTYQRIPQDLPSSLHSLRNRAVEEKLRADGSEERLNFQALEWMIATLPAQEEVNSALDAIGSFFPLQPVTIRLSSPPIEKVLVRLGSLAQLERAADPRAISNCLRTAMYLDIPTMVQNSQIPRESFLKPLQQLLANTDGSTTYDVPFLLRHLLAFADRYFDRSHWEVLHACNVEGSPAYNSTNLALALKSCPRVQSPKDLVLLAMVQGFDAILSASPSNRIAMDLIFERCKTRIFSMVGVNCSEEMRGVWNAIAQQQDPGVRFKQLIEFMVAYPELTGLDMDLFAVLFRSFLKLPCLPPGLLDARTRAQRLLAYIETNDFILRSWDSRCIAGIVELLIPVLESVATESHIGGFLRPSDRAAMPIISGPAWSSSFGRILRHLFMTEPLAHEVSEEHEVGTLGRLISKLCTNAADDVRRRPLHAEPISKESMLNILQRVEWADFPGSTWSMAAERLPLQVIKPAARQLLSLLTYLHNHIGGMEPLLEELLGRRYGIQIICDDLDVGFEIARVAAAISPEWWEKTAARLFDVSWPSGYIRYPDAAAFIAHVLPVRPTSPQTVATASADGSICESRPLSPESHDSYSSQPLSSEEALAGLIPMPEPNPFILGETAAMQGPAATVFISSRDAFPYEEATTAIEYVDTNRAENS